MRLILTALFLCSAVIAQERVPVIVELFTSEGCSSCPPADSLIAELQHTQPIQNADVIVLSEHVDYWNRLGWKDPYSSAIFSQRQNYYADILRAADVFTPQAVIDGRFATVGSNRSNIVHAITSSAHVAKPNLEITVTRQGDDVQVDLASAVKGTVWLALTEAQVTSHVGRGENSGRTLEHAGVVRSLTKFTSHQTHIAVDKQWGANLSIVAFVQDDESGKILQAVHKKI